MAVKPVTTATRYTVIDPQGNVKGVQTLTDNMADRMTDRHYRLLPADDTIVATGWATTLVTHS